MPSARRYRCMKKEMKLRHEPSRRSSSFSVTFEGQLADSALRQWLLDTTYIHIHTRRMGGRFISIKTPWKRELWSLFQRPPFFAPPSLFSLAHLYIPRACARLRSVLASAESDPELTRANLGCAYNTFAQLSFFSLRSGAALLSIFRAKDFGISLIIRAHRERRACVTMRMEKFFH